MSQDRTWHNWLRRSRGRRLGRAVQGTAGTAGDATGGEVLRQLSRTLNPSAQPSPRPAERPGSQNYAGCWGCIRRRSGKQPSASPRRPTIGRRRLLLATCVPPPAGHRPGKPRLRAAHPRLALSLHGPKGRSADHRPGVLRRSSATLDRDRRGGRRGDHCVVRRAADPTAGASLGWQNRPAPRCWSASACSRSAAAFCRWSVWSRWSPAAG